MHSLSLNLDNDIKHGDGVEQNDVIACENVHASRSPRPPDGGYTAWPVPFAWEQGLGFKINQKAVECFS